MNIVKRNRPAKPFDYNIRAYRTKKNNIRYIIEGSMWDNLDYFWCPYTIASGFKTPKDAEKGYNEYLKAETEIKIFNQKAKV